MSQSVLSPSFSETAQPDLHSELMAWFDRYAKTLWYRGDHQHRAACPAIQRTRKIAPN
jgi:hypothetical protein